MTNFKKYFILTEAVATLPLVRRILVDVREARCRLSRIKREKGNLTDWESRALAKERAGWQSQLRECLAEADNLGVEITRGVRCEAWFPFEHQWTGPQGDGKIREAYFAFNDSDATIRQWFFAGWPNDRRPIAAHWWNEFRTEEKLKGAS